MSAPVASGSTAFRDRSPRVPPSAEMSRATWRSSAPGLRPLDRVQPRRRRAELAHRPRRARRGRVRAGGTQRRLRLGRNRRRGARLRPQPRHGRRRACRAVDHRHDRPRRRRRGARGDRLRLGQGRVAADRDLRAAARAHRAVARGETSQGLDGCRHACRVGRRDPLPRPRRGRAGRHVHAALRPRRSGPARTRPGRRLRSPRRHDLRGDDGRGDRARPRTLRGRARAGRRRGARDRVVHGRACRASGAATSRCTRT